MEKGQGQPASNAPVVLEIVSFWRSCPLSEPPFVHPQDLPMLRHRAADLLGLPPTNLDRFITSARFGNPPSFALVLRDALLKCGTNNPSANNFCAKCGTALTNSAQNAKPK